MRSVSSRPASPLTTSGEVFAPAYDVKKVIGLLTPKNADVKAGARMRTLDVQPFSAAGASSSSKTYQKIELAAWAKNPQTVDGKALEMVVSLQGVANTVGVKDVSPETHGAKFLEGRVGGGDRIVGVYKKGTHAERVFEEAKYYGPLIGEAVELYLVRGTALVSGGYPEGGLHGRIDRAL